MHKHFIFFNRRIAYGLCLAAAFWFAFGSGLKVLLAHAAGKSIEIVICTGSGLKKMSVPHEASKSTDHETALKHCSNAPLAIAPSAPVLAMHLNYTQPNTIGTSKAINLPKMGRDWMLNGHPPPGRAPPALS